MMQRTISDYLAELSSVSSYSMDVAKKLSALGLRFPSKYFLMFPGKAAQFELERIKENYGIFRFVDKKSSRFYGVNSELVERKLTELGISRQELVDLSRSYDIDRKIESSEWLAYNTRAVLEAQRSSDRSAIVDEEKVSELNQIGFQYVARLFGIEPSKDDRHVPSKKVIMRSLESSLVGLNFHIKKDPDRYFDGVLSGTSDKDRFEFAVKIDTGFMDSFPVFIKVYVKPKGNLLDDLCEGKNIFMSNQLARPVWPLVPDFGFYIVCLSESDILLSLFAYRAILSELIYIVRDNK